MKFLRNKYSHSLNIRSKVHARNVRLWLTAISFVDQRLISFRTKSEWKKEIYSKNWRRKKIKITKGKDHKLTSVSFSP